MSSRRESPSLSLRGVSIRYPTSDTWIGDKLDLDIFPGELTLLLGPSGCGKSTILLILAGLIPFSIEANLEGKVFLQGDDIADLPHGAAARNVAVVFQDPDAQIVTSTLLDEVCFGLENLLVPAADIEPRALAALTTMGLAATRAEALVSPLSLSGGGRQRLALACALALDPQILILDEPTANLDPVAAAEFYRVIARLKHPSRSIIVVEHEVDNVVPIADRIIALDRQTRVVCDGSPAEVFGRDAAALACSGIPLSTVSEVALRLGLENGRETNLPVDAAQLSVALDEFDQIQWRIFPIPADPAGNQTKSDTADAISICGASVNIAKQSVLGPVSLEVAHGEYLAVAGVNGAGKSTLVRAIAGLVPLSTGAIGISGEALTSLNPRQVADRIGFVFQNPEHQFLAPSVREELAYGLRLRVLTEDEIRTSVDNMLERFDLERYADTNPFLLSHGEKRRLSVGSALITKPDILILDEPTFGQDRARTAEIAGMVRELNQLGLTIILVTHDMQLIADHADRLALLADGRLFSVGPTTDLLCDDGLIEQAGLRPPRLRTLARQLGQRRPEWNSVLQTDQIQRIK